MTIVLYGVHNLVAGPHARHAQTNSDNVARALPKLSRFCRYPDSCVTRSPTTNTPTYAAGCRRTMQMSDVLSCISSSESALETKRRSSVVQPSTGRKSTNGPVTNPLGASFALAGERADSGAKKPGWGELSDLLVPSVNVKAAGASPTRGRVGGGRGSLVGRVDSGVFGQASLANIRVLMCGSPNNRY